VSQQLFAIRHAVELEAFNKAELKRNEGGWYLRSAAEQETKDKTATLPHTVPVYGIICLFSHTQVKHGGC
jgi:hypothetical protein